MNPDTLRALRGTIEKWTKILLGEINDEGADNCPLCAKFNNIHQIKDKDCIGCPVMEKTKNRYCLKSPYIAWQSRNFDRSEYLDPDYQRLAQAELDFLKSLLPPEADE